MRERILFILPITIFVVMLGLGIVSPLMPIYAKKLGANGLWLGIMFSSFAFARMIFMPIVGKLSDEKGRKVFIISGLFFYAIFSLLYANADTVYELTIIRFFHGFVSAMVLPVAMAYMAEAAPEGKEGVVMGIANTSLFLGMGCGPFLGGLLYRSLGMSAVFYSMFLFSLVAFFISLFFLPHWQSSRSLKGLEKVSYKKILKNNIMRGVLLFRAVSAIGRAVVLSFMPLFAASIKLDSADIGLILSVNILIAGVLQTPCGKLADKVSKVFLIVLGSLLAVLSLFLMPLANSFSELFFACFVLGVSAAVGVPAATAIITKVGQGVGMGASMGLFDTAMSVGMLAGPLASGVVMDVLDVKAVFYLASIVSLLGIVVFYSFIRKGIKQKGVSL